MTSSRKIIIGTRQSKLALKQTEIVLEKLKHFYPSLNFVIKSIITKGDRLTEGALRDVYGEEGKSAFTKELQDKLVNGEFDIIIHSMKDAAANLQHENIFFAAYIERGMPWDMLLTKDKKYNSITDLPAGSKIGTVSLRRKAAILKENPNVDVLNLRGTVQTRITKLRENYDAIIMAEAAIDRSQEQLDLQGINFTRINRMVMLPSAGQGTIGIECRRDDDHVISLLKNINHQQTYIITECERSFLKELGGNCFSSISCLAETKDNTITLEGRIASEDGIYLFSIQQSDNSDNYLALGRHCANELKKQIISEKGKTFLNNILNIG